MDNVKLTPPGKTAWWGNKLLNRIIVLLLLLILFFSVYALYDAWRVMHGADNSRLLPYKPGGELGLEELMKLNPDVCAWITIDETNIDYPVVRGIDNMQYLDRDVFGEYEPGGSIFLDYRNSREFTDHYSILFGHHMTGGAMFSDVLEFADKSYFDSHTTGVLLLPGDVSWPIEVFAYMDADGYDSHVYSPIIDDEAALASTLSYIKENATQYREIGVSSTDRIVALSTCTDTLGTDRGIVFGRLVYQ